MHPGGASLDSPPTPIYATDITDLRRWLDTYIDNHPRVGMDTKSYDASVINRPLVDNNQPNPWIRNIMDLMPAAPSRFMVRCKVTAPRRYPNAPSQSGDVPIPWGNADRDHYRDAFAAIRSQSGAVVYAVLTREFVTYEADPKNVTQPLDSSFTNPFITTYANQSAAFAQRILSSGVYAFIIWNEPNGTQGGSISPQHFAALVYNCYKAIKAVAPDVLVFSGGVLMAPNELDGNKVNQGEIDYWHDIYESLSNFRINEVRVPVVLDDQEITSKGPWPWDGIDFHIHRIRTSAYLEDMRNQILDKIVANDRDNVDAVKLVGECGITQENFHDGQRLTSGDPSDPYIFENLIGIFDQICQFSHHENIEDIGTWGVQRFHEDPPSSYEDRSRTGRYSTGDNSGSIQDFWNHLKLSFTSLTADG
jgi:hypothetical protein